MRPPRALPALLFLLILPGAPLAGVDGDITLVGGRLSLTDQGEEWDGAGDWRVRGAMLSLGGSGSVVRFEMTYMRTNEQEVSATDWYGPMQTNAEIRDVSLGILGIWRLAKGIVRPYVGFGLSMVIADGYIGHHGVGDPEEETVSFEDANDLGNVLHGGVRFRIPGGATLGVDFRRLRGASLESQGATARGDYDQIGATLGWGWGK